MAWCTRPPALLSDMWGLRWGKKKKKKIYSSRELIIAQVTFPLLSSTLITGEEEVEEEQWVEALITID